MKPSWRLRHADRMDRSSVERRLEPRFAVSEPVEVTPLEAGDGFPGTTLDASESGLSFASPFELPPGTAIKLGIAEALVLGEVRYCRPMLEGRLEYAVGVAIEYVIFGWKQFYDRVRSACKG